MELKWSLLALVCCLFVCNFNFVQAEDTTQKAVPLEDKSATTTAPATTQKPKIKIADNNICKKCKCDVEHFELDCSDKALTTLFSSEEWDTLQNGDILFDTIVFINNSITNVSVLPEYPVKNLYLGYNQINNITLGAFQNLDKLAKLDLSHNKLTSKSLTPHVFQGQYATNTYDPLKSLIELDLAYNELHNLKADLFIHLPNLESLILCKNQFQVIDPATTLVAIASLANLKMLDMSYMELSELPETIFHSPNELETLLLSGNLFHTVPDALKYAKSLKKLVLDENPLGDFENGNFSEGLTSLTYLSISFLPDTTRIGPGALNSMLNLTTLIASDNPKLSTIHGLAFTKNTINPDTFEYPPLEELHLNNNNLSKVEHEWFARWQDIKTIDLSFNPWTCDCTNSWLIHSLMKQINTSTELLTHNVKCATPAAWKNKPLLELTARYSELLCDNASHPEKNSLILVGILVGVLIGVPLTLASLVMYRRGCFGLRNRINPAAPRYNRASFADDFHI